jgi:DNA/RNA-binding domain of Phe-tRNA-synthetase-like protein
MPAIEYRVSDEIFAQYPTYVRGVVVAWSVENGPSPAPLTALLREAEAQVRTQVILEELAELPQIACWREAFRRFGAKPSEYRSAVEALVRRVLHGQPLPSINKLVDIGTIVSLRHLIPVGGHAIDVVTQDLALRHATGDELFVAFGSQTVEHPLPGEIVFVEGSTVLTRRWTWRQAQHTLTLPETRAIEFNFDLLVPVSAAQVAAIGAEISGLVARFCGGQSRSDCLTREQPSMRFSTESP